MKQFTTLTFVPIAAFIAMLATASAAQSGAYTDGRAAGLSARQAAELKELKAAVGVPTYVPAGFKLESVNIEEPPAPQVVGYTLVYRNARGRVFRIQSANDGIGDASEPRIYGRNPFFNNRLHAGFDFGEGTSVFVSWIESKRAYQPKGSLPQYYSLVADRGDITLREALRVMSSLRYLKR